MVSGAVVDGFVVEEVLGAGFDFGVGSVGGALGAGSVGVVLQVGIVVGLVINEPIP